MQSGIATDSSGNVYASSHNQIYKFTSEGILITKWGSEGTGNGQFNQPIGIATDSDNNVYVVDLYNARIQKFTSDGNFITKWGSIGKTVEQFHSDPDGIGIDSQNNVYITEHNAGRILKFTNDGNLITSWDAPSAYDISLDSLGKAYVASGTNHIHIYSKDSTRPTVISTNPINGAKDASLIKPITVTFSREMDSSTITINTFTVADGNKNAVTGNCYHFSQCCDVFSNF